MTRWGAFDGEFHVRFLDDGRQMELLNPVAYIDRAEVRWPVPEGTQTDGASIPRAFWMFAAPFEGKYRKAALIHDYYCDVRLRTWQAVHRMFYEAMMASGVDDGTAKIMYFGVRVGGPRWNTQAMVNSNLPRPDLKKIDSKMEAELARLIAPGSGPPGPSERQISQGHRGIQMQQMSQSDVIKYIIFRHGLPDSLEEIDERADECREHIIERPR